MNYMGILKKVLIEDGIRKVTVKHFARFPNQLESLISACCSILLVRSIPLIANPFRDRNRTGVVSWIRLPWHRGDRWAKPVEPFGVEFVPQTAFDRKVHDR